MTMKERLQHFPRGVHQLYHDCLLYKNIRDASQTPLNAWTRDHPFLLLRLRKQSNGTAESQTDASTLPLVDPSSGSNNAPWHYPQCLFFSLLYQNEVRRPPGRIPRRQHEQQRRLRVDLSMVLPLIVLWLPPIIGYLPLLLAIVAPRQVLSRQFLNEYEIRTFAALEYQQRHQYFASVSEHFWIATTTSNNGSQPFFSSSFPTLGNSDVAGPVIDPIQLFDDTDATDGTAVPQNPYRHFLSSVQTLPREYLMSLALALGIHQRLPVCLAHMVTQWCTPRWWLHYHINRHAQAVVTDDALLLEEGAANNRAAQLTDREVWDACLLRGLPIVPNDDTHEMRLCLTNHLIMMSSVKERLRPSHRSDEAFRLLTVHLPILRASHKSVR